MVHTSLSDKPSRVVLMNVDNNSGSGIDVSTRKPVQVCVMGGGGGSNSDSMRMISISSSLSLFLLHFTPTYLFHFHFVPSLPASSPLCLYLPYHLHFNPSPSLSPLHFTPPPLLSPPISSSLHPFPPPFPPSPHCHQIKLSDYELEDTLRGCIDKSELPTLLSLLKASLQLTKQGVYSTYVV